MLLVGCSFTSDFGPIQAPSAATSDSATSEPGVTLSPTMVFPVPVSVTQGLIKGGVEQVMRRMMGITNSRPALKLDVSASEVTLVVLETDQKPSTLHWRVDQITPAESDIQYLGQTTSRPTDYPLGNISELFDITTRVGTTGTEKALQVVEQRSGEVCLTITTTPEMKTVSFEKDGTVVHNLGCTSITDLTDSLTAVIAGSCVTTQIGFGPNTGHWIDLSANNDITERRIHSTTLPAYTTRLKGTSSLTPLDPTQLSALVLTRSIQEFNYGSKAEHRIEVDNRYRRRTPIIRYSCSGRVHSADPDGIGYSENQLKQ